MTTAMVASRNEKTRVIFQCKRKTCQHVWAIEYRTFIPTNGLYRMVEVDGMRKRVFIGDDYNAGCPKCGNNVFIESNRVVGKVSEHVCDARCMTAKGGDCECSCGGANHGISHLG